jgi:hypothetical protein
MLYGFLVQHVSLRGSAQFWSLRPSATDAADSLRIVHLGCYGDKKALIDNQRAMPEAVGMAVGPSGIVLACAREAVRRKKRLFSVQAGNECRVGDDEAAAKRYGVSNNCVSADTRGLNTGAGVTMALYRADDPAYVRRAIMGGVTRTPVDVAPPSDIKSWGSPVVVHGGPAGCSELPGMLGGREGHAHYGGQPRRIYGRKGVCRSRGSTEGARVRHAGGRRVLAAPRPDPPVQRKAV